MNSKRGLQKSPHSPHQKKAFRKYYKLLLLLTIIPEYPLPPSVIQVPGNH